MEISESKNNNLKKNGDVRKRYYLDLTGRYYGKLEVIKKNGFRGKNVLWECFCHYCGSHKNVVAAQLKKYTKSCGCRRTIREWNSPYWKGIGEIPKTILNNIKNGALKRNKTYEISNEYIWNLFLKQERKCALSGIEIKFGRKSQDITASLDRIDSSIGYLEGNVQWVHKHINAMKLNHSEKYFLELCSLIVKYNKKVL